MPPALTLPLHAPVSPPAELPARAPSLAAHLKASTATAHAALEALIDLQRPLTRARYVDVLQRFTRFVPVWEAHLAESLPPRLRGMFDARRRAHLLHDDLTRLGSPPLAPQADLPRYGGLAEALGGLYVMEGSTLGGAIMARWLDEDLGITEDTGGGAYFRGHGPATGPMWKALQALLDEEVPPESHDLAVRGAQQTFTALARVFTPVEDVAG